MPHSQAPDFGAQPKRSRRLAPEVRKVAALLAEGLDDNFAERPGRTQEGNALSPGILTSSMEARVYLGELPIKLALVDSTTALKPLETPGAHRDVRRSSCAMPASVGGSR